MSNTATVITTKAGEALIAQMQAENKVLVIDKFIFANVPNRPAFPNRDDVVPVEHVVHESAVHEQGRLTENSVIYSTTLASNVGPFSFNWSGLFCSEHNVLVAINFPPPVDKTVDAPGITGNTLVRSFVLEYKGISETTNITVDPSSWQYDAHKRMSKMDNDTAQAIIDQNGKDWFIDDGFIVTPQSGAYSIKAGAGYVSGHRISLDFDRIIQVPEKPAFIYVDAFREGSPTGEWQTKFTFVVSAEEKDDYTDAQGVNHFVCKIAQVLADGSVADMRKKGSKVTRDEFSNFTEVMPRELIGGGIFPISYIENARINDEVEVETEFLRIAGTLYPTSKLVSGQITQLNIVAKPYMATVGGEIVHLLDIRYYSRNRVYVRSFWVEGKGMDETLGIQAALDVGKGKEVAFHDGTFIISMAASQHPHSCLQVDMGTTVTGVGKESTIITRPASERGVNGVLIVNKGYDLREHGGNYSAAGNIVFRDLGITDGVATQSRSLGDLIGFGNGDGLLVENCWFGNHDQHAVDISKSRNVKITKCKSANKVNSRGAATYQIDAGLIWGITGEITPSYNVSIYENEILDSMATNVIHFHSQEHAKNIRIYNNVFDLPSLPDGCNAIGSDGDISFENVSIHHNEIKLYNIGTRGINLPIKDTVTLCDNLNIRQNTISGVFRTGIYVGGQPSSRTDFQGPLKRVYVSGNTINSDIRGEILPNNWYGILVGGFKFMEVNKNKVIVNQTENQPDASVIFISSNDNENSEVCGNTLRDEGLGYLSTTNRIPIFMNVDRASNNNLRAITNIKGNTISVREANYQIQFKDPGDSAITWKNLFGIISGNTFVYDSKICEIFELQPLSDGTNNQRYIDLTAFGASSDAPYILPISSGQRLQDIKLPGRKKSKINDDRVGVINIDIEFSPLKADGFVEDTESVQTVYISATEACGMIVKDMRCASGKFDLVTGNKGVSMIINDSEFTPVLRTSGWIRIRAGI
ncbi:phage tail protein [Photobacterium kishitanii]|uniref:phage tail-collar fiber domain-containing protein n=1 Tax=Photobacterium kishitanii TaxID=318456 RepID=UPI00071AECB3|nr:phage tail protein [Photobacterium kishitanii]